MWVFFYSSRGRHTVAKRDWSSDVCSSDLDWRREFGTAAIGNAIAEAGAPGPDFIPVMADDGSGAAAIEIDRKSTRLNSSHVSISYAVFCLKKKKNIQQKYLCTNKNT